MQIAKRTLISLFLVAIFAASASAATLTLNWQDNSSAESGFEIERCIGANCTAFAKVGQVGANITTYADTTLGENVTASYRVRAIATGGIVSAYSNVASGTSTINPPSNLLVQ